MKKILLLSLLTVATNNARTINVEYQKMLDVRANLLGLSKPQKLQGDSQPLPMLIEEEKSLNNQFTDLLQQLKNLDISK